ncbi:MAG: YiiD C-terminal domain-containing protein [Sinimarinibacterium sp.]|jgi:thioesterase domain-containing protein
MTPEQLTAFLHNSIALTRAIGVRVTRADGGCVRLVAPLEPNLNHHGTAFGGSLATVGILAGWIALHNALAEAGIEAALVVRKTDLDYLQPVTGELVAESELPQESWLRFKDSLQRGQRARIEVHSRLLAAAGVDGVVIRATYVALPHPST